VVVTGCTSGTGFICAKACAELGGKVIMLNRASERANLALESLKAAVPDASVSLVTCDLMSFASVRDAAAQLTTVLADEGLDVLCNNAGIMATEDKATEDGCDTQMQTNHLSHFLLTAEVWPLLEKAAALRGEARIVNHSSSARNAPNKKMDAQYLGKNGGNLGGDKDGWIPFTGPRWERYQQSKLANVVFTYALDDKLKASKSNIKAFVAHPGGASTSLGENSSSRGGGTVIPPSVAKMLLQSGEDGTMPLLTCCCVTDAKSGEFYGPKTMMSGPVTLQKEEALADSASRDLLWQESIAITGAAYSI